MKSEYQAIFERRGLSYDKAMRLYPDARDNEFNCLFANLDKSTLARVVDIPSGGGYLRKFLPQSQIDELEPCDEFETGKGHGAGIDLENLQLQPDHYNLVISLAAIHHVKNKQGFVASAYNALRPGAHLCIGDVAWGSSITDFLDGFAGKHNGTGHKGDYLTPQGVRSLLRNSSFNVVEIKEKPCPWVFSDASCMLEFCRLLFGLVAVEDEVLLQALQDYVGVSVVQGKTLLNWRLLYATAQKSIACQ